MTSLPDSRLDVVRVEIALVVPYQPPLVVSLCSVAKIITAEDAEFADPS